MKKILLLLGVVFSIALLSCDNKNNCFCKITDSKSQVVKEDIYLKDSENTCEKVEWSDLPDQWANTNIAGGYILECFEE